jgi:hypothetical protein
MARAGASPPPGGIPAKIASHAKSKIAQILPKHFVHFAEALAQYGQVTDTLISGAPYTSVIAWSAIKLVLNERSSFGPSNVVKIMELAIGNLGFRELD